MFKNAAVLSSSSLATVGLSLISAKLYAIWVGPSGFGQLALVQGIVGWVALLAELGLGTVIVREGARLVSRDGDPSKVVAFAHILEEVRSLAWILLTVAVGLLLVFRAKVGAMVFGSELGASAVLWCAVAVFFAVMANLRVSVLNAYQAVGAMVRISVGSALASTIVVLVLVHFNGERGIAPGAAAASFSRWLFTYWSSRRLSALSKLTVSLPSLASVQRLVTGGLPIALGAMIGIGTQYMIPLVLLPTIGKANVGLIQAASSITSAVLGAIAAALSQDYLPRISALKKGSPEFKEGLDNELRIALVIAIPVILAVQALAPHTVPLILSKEFLPILPVMSWLLLAEVFRFGTIALTYAVIAHMPGRTFLLSYSIPVATSVGLLFVLPGRFGLQGVGMAILLGNLAGFVILSVVVRVGLRSYFSVPNLGWLAAAVSVTLIPNLFSGATSHVIAYLFAALSIAWAAANLIGRRGGLRSFKR